MKKVLIITYYWPPASGPGAQRFLKFAKFLPKSGWNPHILTIKDGSYPAIDPTLKEDIPDGLKVTKTKALEPFKIYNLLQGKRGKSFSVASNDLKNDESLFKRLSNYIRSNYFIPDARIGWNRYAYKSAKQIIEKEGIDIVITTGPPHSTHLIGQKLKKNLPIKWVADFRDPWVTIAYEKYLKRTQKSMRKNQALETSVLKSCDKLIVVSKGLKEEFKAKVPNADIDIIHNGFDAEDLPKSNENNPTDYFTLSYVGNLKITQNPHNLWKALNALKREIPDFGTLFKLNITGNINSSVKASIEAAGLIDMLELHPFVQHKEAVRIMFNANMLLLPIPEAENNKLILTGKIFEYLSSQNPILGIGPIDGNAAEVLEDCGRNSMFDYEDAIGIKHFIKEQYSHWITQHKQSFKFNDKNYEQYARSVLTEKLSNQLDLIHGTLNA